jgi:hypothetical protein
MPGTIHSDHNLGVTRRQQPGHTHREPAEAADDVALVHRLRILAG